MTSSDAAITADYNCADQLCRVRSGDDLCGRLLAGDPRFDQHALPGPGHRPAGLSLGPEPPSIVLCISVALILVSRSGSGGSSGMTGGLK